MINFIKRNRNRLLYFTISLVYVLTYRFYLIGMPIPVERIIIRFLLGPLYLIRDFINTLHMYI